MLEFWQTVISPDTDAVGNGWTVNVSVAVVEPHSFDTVKVIV